MVGRRKYLKNASIVMPELEFRSYNLPWYLTNKRITMPDTLQIA